MRHYNYEYHESKRVTKPRKTKANIKGLELEISDDSCGNLLDELIDDNILTIPSNENEEKDYVIALEEDGSVYKELIFKASCNQTLINGVKCIEERLKNKITNGHGTSCHIHLNNEYLKEQELNDYDITKSCEFLAPIMFAISGRNKSSVSQWAESAISGYISIDNDDLYERAQYIDEELNRYNGRYSIVNPTDKTTEIRIFSNYYKFDSEYIRLYLEISDFVIEIAKYMKERMYQDEVKNLIEMTKEFFSKRNRKKFVIKHNLSVMFATQEEKRLARAKTKLEKFKETIRLFENEIDNEITDINNRIEFLRRLRDIGGLTVEFDVFGNLNDVQNQIIEILENNIAEIENEQ